MVLNQLNASNEERAAKLREIERIDGMILLAKGQLSLIDKMDKDVAEKSEAERIALAKERSEPKSGESCPETNGISQTELS